MDEMDIEEQISAFSVRKMPFEESGQQQKQFHPRKSYPVEPILIRDLLAVDTSNDDFISAFNGSYQFRQCFIYGRIVGCSSNSNKKWKTYTVDDGTACIDVTVFNKDKATKELQNMKQNIHVIEKLKVKESLRGLLYVSERLMDVFNLILGTRILVFGRPKIYREKLCLVSDNLFVDDGIDRKLEVAFKDNLIDCYMLRKIK